LHTARMEETGVDKSAALSYITAAEDEELDASIDIRNINHASCDSKTSSALGHLDIFLENYCKKMKTPRIQSRHLNYYGIKTTGTYEEANKWWDDMIGNFFGYLCQNAYNRRDPDKGQIEYESATGYASRVKAYYTHQFRHCGPELAVFSSTKWRVLRNKLLVHFTEVKRTTGKALVNGHEASEDSDRGAIAIGCYWLGTPEAAEFLHLNNTMFMLSGRGTEVSLLTKDCLKASDVN
jgi:hypothetical protein